jgi:hypothetical protein
MIHRWAAAVEEETIPQQVPPLIMDSEVGRRNPNQQFMPANTWEAAHRT